MIIVIYCLIGGNASNCFESLSFINKENIGYEMKLEVNKYDHFILGKIQLIHICRIKVYFVTV